MSFCHGAPQINPAVVQPFEEARARLPRDTAAKVSMHVGAAGDAPQRWLEDGASVLVVDPPRKGLDRALVRTPRVSLSHVN